MGRGSSAGDITRHADAYFAIKVLEGAVLSAGLLGVAMTCFPRQSLPLFEWMLYKSRGIPIPYNSSLFRHNQFIYGVAGAVTTGWSVSLHYAIKSEEFLKGKNNAHFGIIAPLCVWFVMDSTCSVVTGNWPNAVLNSVFAAAFGIPLLILHKYFDEDSKRA